ncbi:MAG: glutamine-hydrolyzing GMP synthase, partial [Pseudobdellovibrio sp.]
MQTNRILILDFGSQVTMLIARRLRELGYYSEIKSYQTPLEEIKKFNPKAVILSGGPFSVYETESPTKNVKEMLDIAPVLGICYGMQLLAHQMGGSVESAKHREYGHKEIQWVENFTTIKHKIPLKHNVWMSHGDVVTQIPSDAKLLCKTQDHIAGFYSDRYWALQYHPEVSHSEYGSEVLELFMKHFGIHADWNAQSLFDNCSHEVLKLVKADEHVLCALSGGVDSSVVATLLTKVLGAERVHCVFINNGLLRLNEFENVLEQYKKIGLNVIGLDKTKEFLVALRGLSDPEKKRKAIGKTFIDVFDQSINEELKSHKDKIKFLAQGTLYPDVIESVSSVGGSVTIKSHHNVGGLPDKMKLKLVEPVRYLFKD